VELKQLDPNYLNRLADLLLELTRKKDPDWNYEIIMSALISRTHPLNGDPCFIKDLNKAIQQFRDELPRLDLLLNQSRVKSSREFPPVWIKSNKGIMRNLNKKGNQHFLPLHEILMDSRIKQGEKKAPVLVLPDYAAIEKKTGLKKKYAYRYIREMCRWGILQRDHREGRNGPWVYCLGVWMPGKGKTPRPIYFLKETPEMKAALIQFDAQREQ
jgi:hypothetical protein